MSDVTRILSQIESGDPSAVEQLLPLVYEELRKLAAAKLIQEKPGKTLQATALVHEAYLRLVDDDQDRRWNSRGHFFAAAAEAMRRILVESARRKRRLKHGGGQGRVDLEGVVSLVPDGPAEELLALDRALGELAAVAPERAAIVQLRYFAGLSWEEIASCQGISLATAKRRWLVARAWLYSMLSDEQKNPDSRRIS
jgi:RNA polymerase sigma factor (TIGR02999 family)